MNLSREKNSVLSITRVGTALWCSRRESFLARHGERARYLAPGTMEVHNISASVPTTHRSYKKYTLFVVKRSMTVVDRLKWPSHVWPSVGNKSNIYSCKVIVRLLERLTCQGKTRHSCMSWSCWKSSFANIVRSKKATVAQKKRGTREYQVLVQFTVL